MVKRTAMEKRLRFFFTMFSTSDNIFFQINKALNFIILKDFWGIVRWCLESILSWRVVDIWCVRSLKILTKWQQFVQLVAKTHAVTHATWVHSILRYLPMWVHKRCINWTSPKHPEHCTHKKNVVECQICM